MKKRVLFDKNTNQFVMVPTFGFIRQELGYLFRIGFMFGPFLMSIGCFRRNDDDRA